MENTVRVDKWLWYARFFKSRALASKACGKGRLRVNGVTTRKSHYQTKVGDILTFAKGEIVRVVKIEKLAERRGSFLEAQNLYDDLTPKIIKVASEIEQKSVNRDDLVAPRERGSGRPTKIERRALEIFLRQHD